MQKNKPKQVVKPEGKINYFREILYTFSNRKSLFSSKKIERFIVFNVFLSITVYYIFRNINDIKPLEFVQVIGLWLVYGGYNSIMNYRDKKIDALPPLDDDYSTDEDVDGGRARPNGNQVDVDNPD